MSAADALALAGAWPLTATDELAELSQFEMEDGRPGLPDQQQINLRCAVTKGWKYDNSAEANSALDAGPCMQSVDLLAVAGQEVVRTLDDILAGVLRHMVMAHNWPTNKKAQDG